MSSQSSHQPQEVLLAQFSLYVHKGGLKPDSFHFILIELLIPERFPSTRTSSEEYFFHYATRYAGEIVVAFLTYIRKMMLIIIELLFFVLRVIFFTAILIYM